MLLNLSAHTCLHLDYPPSPPRVVPEVGNLFPDNPIPTPSTDLDTFSIVPITVAGNTKAIDALISCFHPKKH
jgi:cobaltochelatase CobN